MRPPDATVWWLPGLRPPDQVIGTPKPYLRRWWWRRSPRGNVYLHQILRSDDDRALHDHPWWNVSIILSGGYIEVTPQHPKGRRRRVGRVIFRRAEASHRLVLRTDPWGRDIPCWSLFVTGPKIRHWGFWCPKGWVHWRDFTAGPNGESVGKGCGE